MARGDERSSSLPMDIIETILSRLPAKSLLRFKAVCKSWNNMISDPRFIQNHLQRSKNSISQDLFLGRNSASKASKSRRSFSLLRLEDGKFQTEAVLEAPGSVMLCSCDGVLLLKGFAHREFLLWNPSCRKITRFYYPYESWSNSGLCHDPTIDDFKIVIVDWKYYAVYSCKSKSWTRSNELGFFVDGDVYWARWIKNELGIFVDGAMYWVWIGRVDDRIGGIVYFDSRDDKLKMLQKPKDLKDTDEISLICLRDRLCVWFHNVDKSVVQIWIKEEGRDRNSWMELMTIDNVPTPFRRSLRPLFFLGNKILIYLRGGKFLIYFPYEKTFEEFKDQSGVKFNGRFLYVDSLLFFPIQKTLPQRKRKSTYSRN